MRKIGKAFVVAAALVMSMSLMTGCGDDKTTEGKLDGSNTETKTEAGGEKGDVTAGMSLEEYIDYYAADVTLGEYTGIEYDSSPAEVKDEDVQKKVDEFVESCKTYKEDRESAAQNGDIVNIDFVGSVDGVEFDGGNTKGSGYDLVLGSGSFIDDFEAQVEGHKPGEQFEVRATFPEDYGKEELNGKEAVFVTTLNYIKVPIEATYNDELVAANTDYSNTADYEEAIRNDIKASNEEAALANAQNLVMVTAINNAEIENLPQDEITTMAEKINESIKAQAESYNVEYSVFIQYYYGYEDETEFNEYVNAVCEESMKEKKLVCAIAKKEGITVNEDDEAAYIKTLAADNSMSEEDVKNAYSDEDIMYYTLAEKVMQFMLDNGVNKPGTGSSEEAKTQTETEETSQEATEE